MTLNGFISYLPPHSRKAFFTVTAINKIRAVTQNTTFRRGAYAYNDSFDISLYSFFRLFMEQLLCVILRLAGEIDTELTVNVLVDLRQYYRRMRFA